MQRFALALFFALAVVGLVVALLRGVGRAAERRGGVASLTTGTAMQKAAFILLMCLIVYVSVTGAS
jgi:hypothetical protein